MGIFGSGDGLFGGVNEWFHGERPDDIKPSGAYPGIDKIGTEYSKYLLDLISNPVEKTKSFQYGSEAIRELVGRQAGASRQRLGDASLAGGFSDSGAVLSGMGDIDRGELQSYTQGLNQLIMDLEMRRSAEILPFLQGGASESLAVQNFTAQNILRGLEWSNQTSKDISSEARGWMSGFSGGGF